MDLHDKVAESVDFLAKQVGIKPRIALVLGSGLGSLAEQIDDAVAFSYGDIPHFNASGAPTHAGRLVFGTLAERDVVCMQGRIHLYEGYEPEEVTYGVFVLKAMGAATIIMTNATGGIRPDLEPGDIVAITDHINFTGRTAFSLNSALPEERRVYQSFVDMTDAYSPALRAKAHAAADACGVALTDGVYVATHGPQLETPAEIRAFGMWGADVVGMSTVLEVIAARSVQMDVLCLSFVSNKAAGLAPDGITAEDIFTTVKRASGNMCALISALLPEL